MTSESPRAQGRRQYFGFLEVAGMEFSPMCPLRAPVVLAGYPFWTVEGLWQGTKVMRLDGWVPNQSAALPFEVLANDDTVHDVWFPCAGVVRHDFRRSRFFRALKSGRTHNRERNRLFGQDRWTFRGHYLPGAKRILREREEAMTPIHRPAYRVQLEQYPEAMARLARLIKEDRVAITGAMLHAHPHFQG